MDRYRTKEGVEKVLRVGMIGYRLPMNPGSLNHRKRNPWELFCSLVVSSHVCQVCGRKEPNVIAWNQVDDPIHHDRDGCSVVCDECFQINKEYFEKNQFSVGNYWWCNVR